VLFRDAYVSNITIKKSGEIFTVLKLEYEFGPVRGKKDGEDPLDRRNIIAG
jgi:hypothetical protein